VAGRATAVTIILVLIPITAIMGLIGLIAFWWTLQAGQYDDPAGDAARILMDDDDKPG
jgi:cbb3-type cytochrome oxidase maturation protein